MTPRKKRIWWICCLGFFFSLLGMLSCCDVPVFRTLLGEQMMAGRSAWITAKMVDQYDTPCKKTDFLIEYLYLPLWGGPLKSYFRTETSDERGILDLGPRGSFCIKRSLDDAFAPIHFYPSSVPGRSKVRTTDPYGNFVRVRENGYPESPRIIPVWRNVGPQRLQEIAWEESIEGIGPIVYAFDPFAGKQISLGEIQSATHAIIIREFHTKKMPDSQENLSNRELNALCSFSRYVLYPKGISWYCVEYEQHTSCKAPMTCLMGVYPAYLHSFPIQRKDHPESITTILGVTSQSSSQSALIDLRLQREEQWKSNRHTLQTTMEISILVNNFGMSFESFDRKDHQFHQYNRKKHGYTWKQCTNRQEYLAIDPSYPALEKRDFVRSTPVFDPKIPVPPEYDRVPERIVDCQWETFPFFRGGDPIVPPPITQPNYNPNISEE